MGWADPDRRIAVGLMTSGKPLFYPEIFHYSDVFKQIGLACPKESGFDWYSSLSRPTSSRAPAPSEFTLH
jgi:hypothetical protein